MKLFFCTNSESIVKPHLRRLLYNSMGSALENTCLNVFLVYDGKREEIVDIDKRVTIIEHRHRLYNTLINTRKKDIAGFNMIATGSFLRTEIPMLCKSHGFLDDYCLYSDFDVIFNKADFSGLYEIKPEFFAAAPEHDKNNFTYFNAGILWMNLKTMFKEDLIIMNHISHNINNLHVLDQTAYNNLYGERFTRLPLEYNWKPYWGINHEAKIIHWHGAKPRSTEPPERYNLDIIKYLRSLDADGYEYYNKVWEDLLYYK